MDKRRIFVPAALTRGSLLAVAAVVLAVWPLAAADDVWLSSPDANRAAPTTEAFAGIWRGEMETPEGSAELTLHIGPLTNGDVAVHAETAAWPARRSFSVRIEGRSLSLVSRPADGGGVEADPVELRLSLSHDNRRLAGVWHQPASGVGGRAELLREGGAAVVAPESIPTAPDQPVIPENTRTVVLDETQLTVRIPARARVGEEVSVRVEALNAAGESRIGTIAVTVFGLRCGIPEDKSAYDLLLPAMQRPMAAFVRDGEVWKVRPRSEQVRPTAPHVEIFTRNWPAGERRELRFPIRFLEAGTAQLFIRATFCRTATGPGVIVKNIPDSGPPDEQGLPCTICAIDVI